jgi:hypothetical protein
VGTLIVTSCEFEPLYFIPSALSRIDDLDYAWSQLRVVGDEGHSFDVKASIGPDVRGFSELASMLLERQHFKPSGMITAIEVAPHMYYGDEPYLIATYVVLIAQDTQPSEVTIAWVEDVQQWVSDERLRWSLACGFPVLCGGLIVSLFAMLVPTKRRAAS